MISFQPFHFSFTVPLSNNLYLFACPIITHEPFDLFASNFERGTRENHWNVFGLVLRLGKIVKIVINGLGKIKWISRIIKQTFL